MGNNLDELLKHALTPVDEPDFWLNQRIVNRVKEQRTMTNKNKRRFPAVAAIAALVMCLSSATVYAALMYLHPAEVAEEVQDTKLSEVFLGENATIINETQNYGEYRVSLLSMVSGESLSNHPYYNNGVIKADRTYAVVAIENEDGTPMPETMEDSYGELEFFASPLIGGYQPAFYNIASMSGNYTDITEDGVLYRLLECDNVEIFADHTLYLCVTEGVFYNTEAYNYDKVTGKISRNEEYKGLNALFVLPMDGSKADPVKASEYIFGLGIKTDIAEEKVAVEEEILESIIVDVAEDEDKGAEVVEYALQFVGIPYAWGCDSLTEGTDSSGFTKSIYEYFGISLEHDSRKQMEAGIEVDSVNNAKAGDLVFYDTPAHVAIYVGDELVVHSMPQEGICISEVDFDEVAGVRRILD